MVLDYYIVPQDLQYGNTDIYHVFCKPSKVLLTYNVMVCSLCAN